MIISFNLEVVTAAKRVMPGLTVLWLVGTTPKHDEETNEVLVTLAQRIDDCCRAGLDGLSMRHDSELNENSVGQIRRVGLQLHVWTVNSAEEARNLVALAGKVSADALVLGLGEHRHLMTVCFCCECCCLARAFRRGPVNTVDSIMHPVEGLTVEVTEACVGCGTCVESCFIQAIQVRAGQAVIDTSTSPVGLTRELAARFAALGVTDLINRPFRGSKDAVEGVARFAEQCGTGEPNT